MKEFNFFGSKFFSIERWKPSKFSNEKIIKAISFSVENTNNKPVLYANYEEVNITTGDILVHESLSFATQDHDFDFEWVKNALVKYDCQVKEDFLYDGLYLHVVRRENGSNYPLPLIYASSEERILYAEERKMEAPSEEEIKQLKAIIEKNYGLCINSN